MLREHRGDGHVAALLVAGLDGAETPVWRAAVDGARAALQPARGWTDEEWEDGVDGWCATAAGSAPTGRRPPAVALRARRWRRRPTGSPPSPGRASARPGPARFVELATPLSLAARAELPDVTPLGLPQPTGQA